MLPDERNRMVEENLGLVGQVIKDKVRDIRSIGFLTYDDLFQTGCIGLCKAADTYKPGKGQFSTYAYILIRNEIFDALEHATLRRNREEFFAPEELPDMGTADVHGDSLHELNRILDVAQTDTAGVTAKGIEAIRLLALGYTHREIGEQMGGTSANNVSAWVARARKYLKSRPDIIEIGAAI